MTETKKNFQEVCEILSSDLITVKEAIERGGRKMSYDNFRRLIREDEACRKDYEISKMEQAEVGADVIKNMIRESIANQRDPKEAAHIVSMTKWLCEKYAPRLYGDRTSILAEEMYEKLQKMVKQEMNGEPS
jgi:hypothetical protein